jgi:hypothetical protein
MADGNPIDPKALQQVRARIGDPKFREALVTEAYSKKDLAEIRLKQTQTNTSMAAGALDRAKTTYVQQLTTNAKNKEASGKKVGVDYKPEDKDSIADLAHKDFPDADPATLRALSMDAAQYAHTLMTQGMTKNNAYKEAYKKYKDISFAGLTETKLRPGSSPENPLDTPENPTPETMVKNKFYHGKDKTTGEEILYRWDGQKPVPWPGGTSRGEALSDEEVEGHEPNPIADEDEVGY